MISAINLLCIADTHGAFSYYYPVSFVRELTSRINLNAVLLLGDLNLSDIKDVISCFRSLPVFAVCGNHDEPVLYTNNDIPEIHGKIVDVSGVRVLGWHGSVKYKEYQPFCFTQEESHELYLSMPSCDILVSHDMPLGKCPDRNNAHAGLIGITEYLNAGKCKLHLHGHIHESDLISKINGIDSISVYPMGVLKYNDGQYEYQCIDPIEH